VVLGPIRSERVPSERVPVDQGGSNGRITYSDGDGIQVIEPDGSGQVQLISGRDPGYPAWSSDGAKIAFVRGTSLFVTNADGSGETLVQGPINDSNYSFFSPSWSPDGNQLVFAAGFTSTRDGSYKLYVVNVDGSGLTKIPQGDHQDWWPSWSPDGTKIAFATGTVGSERDLATISPDGSNRTTLVRGWVNYPDWSPDGSQILFVDTTSGWDVFAIGSDGTGRIRLTDSPDEEEFFPVYAPDGTQIAFRRRVEGSGTYIFTMVIGGTEAPVRVVKVTSTEDPVAWQPT
jgi:Tol biopolymer transport system component